PPRGIPHARLLPRAARAARRLWRPGGGGGARPAHPQRPPDPIAGARHHRVAPGPGELRHSMPAELGLVTAAAGVLALTVALAALVLHTPRCPACRRPGQPEARELAGAGPSLIVLVYQCPPCGQALGRRTLFYPD